MKDSGAVRGSEHVTFIIDQSVSACREGWLVIEKAIFEEEGSWMMYARITVPFPPLLLSPSSILAIVGGGLNDSANFALPLRKDLIVGFVLAILMGRVLEVSILTEWKPCSATSEMYEIW